MLSKNKTFQEKIKSIIQEQGAELLGYKVFIISGKSIIRCLVDYPTGGITMDNCVKINRKIFSYLEENNSSGEDYAVEINSPGLDRPLKEYKDFLRVKGKTILLWLNEPVCEKEYLEGEVKEVNENKLSLSYKDEIIDIDFNKVKLGKEKIEIK